MSRVDRLSDPVHAVADAYVAELARHEPDAAQAIGSDSEPDLPDLGPEWLQRKYELQGEIGRAHV